MTTMDCTGFVWRLLGNEICQRVNAGDLTIPKQRIVDHVTLMPAAYFWTGNYYWMTKTDTYHFATVRPFFMDQKLFTYGDKAKLRGIDAFKGFKWPEMPFNEDFAGSEKPMIYVTLAEADEICRRQGKRLPTADEWESAALFGGTYVYDIHHKRLNDDIKDCHDQDITCNVGSYPSDKFGLFDVSGNVAQWVLSEEDGVQETSDGHKGLFLGASWRFSSSDYVDANDHPARIQGAFNTFGGDKKTFHSAEVGFRCAMDISQMWERIDQPSDVAYEVQGKLIP